MDSLSQAKQHYDEIVRRGLERFQTPALTAAWTDRENLLHVGVWGEADPTQRVALNQEHLFNFGSIGKSFTCIALLQADEKGLVDLQAPVTQYLPWFVVQSDFRPITLHDLMSHASGLPAGTDQETEAMGEVWNLRHVQTGFPPGEQFYYSNSGYKTLGMVLEKIYGMPYPRIIQQQVLDPLEMKNTLPVLTLDVQPRFARAFMPRCDDRPHRLDADLIPVPWIESATADGCISSNAADLAAYARVLLNRGVGPNGRILSEESFGKMIQPYQQRADELAYGYGMMIWEEDGFHCVGHSGSIPGYLAFMRLDMDNGLAAVTLMTEPAIGEVSGIGLKTLRAGVLGTGLPEDPFSKHLLAVDNPEDYIGHYTGQTRSFDVRSEGDRLVLVVGEQDVSLEPRGKDAFLAHHPAFELFLLRFQCREGDDGPVNEAYYGGEWFRGERYQGPEAYPAFPDLEQFVGHYRAHNIWSTNFRVVIRKDRLYVIHPHGREGLLAPLEDGSFLIQYPDNPVSVERLTFRGLVDCKAVIARYSGSDYYRFFTP